MRLFFALIFSFTILSSSGQIKAESGDGEAFGEASGGASGDGTGGAPADGAGGAIGVASGVTSAGSEAATRPQVEAPKPLDPNSPAFTIPTPTASPDELSCEYVLPEDINFDGAISGNAPGSVGDQLAPYYEASMCCDQKKRRTQGCCRDDVLSCLMNSEDSGVSAAGIQTLLGVGTGGANLLGFGGGVESSCKIAALIAAGSAGLNAAHSAVCTAKIYSCKSTCGDLETKASGLLAKVTNDRDTKCISLPQVQQKNCEIAHKQVISFLTDLPIKAKNKAEACSSYTSNAISSGVQAALHAGATQLARACAKEAKAKNQNKDDRELKTVSDINCADPSYANDARCLTRSISDGSDISGRSLSPVTPPSSLAVDDDYSGAQGFDGFEGGAAQKASSAGVAGSSSGFPSASGGGFGAGGAAGGPGRSAYDPNIMDGTQGVSGGAGGGAAPAGGGGGGNWYGNRDGDQGKGGLDLKKFIPRPGGKRGLASIGVKRIDGITGANDRSIWEKVSSAMQLQCRQPGRLVNCRR